jgi:hypothetical protein
LTGNKNGQEFPGEMYEIYQKGTQTYLPDFFN